ncbi:hypothetical protein IFM89_031567 [Coptis chinensis]|uniref:Uncharacterized protein n=1 Tax=Coptis chinensis TaxID=261450 RepID=A0A835LP19_9MAGN|nr:hypothetical protein IFM89_031567 [Coptis chinensis]
MRVVNVTSMIFLAWILAALYVGTTAADRSTCIIHMGKFSMPKAFANHHEWYSASINSLEVTDATNSETAKSTSIIIYTYDNAIHGFSAVLSLEEVQELKKSHGFVSAYPDKIVKLDTTHTFVFLSLNTEFGLWPQTNYGKDVIIGMMDTGVWSDSRSFNDDGMTEVPTRWKGICQAGDNFNSLMCNRKLIGARYFSRGAETASLSSTGVNTPRDRFGHGTHTLSTVAGNYVEGVSFFGYAKGTTRGIAPRARLAMYRVTGSVGYGSDLLAGMDQAIADGVDIISISMGLLNAYPIYEDPIAIAAFAAMEKGVLVSSSAGNGMSTTSWSQFPENALLVDMPLVYNETLLAATRLIRGHC